MPKFNIRKTTTLVAVYSVEAENAELAVFEVRKGGLSALGSGSNEQIAIIADTPPVPVATKKAGVTIPASALRSTVRKSVPAEGAPSGNSDRGGI